MSRLAKELRRANNVTVVQAGESVVQALARTRVAAEAADALDECERALYDLLADTQHSDHACGDGECPVAKAHAVLAKLGGGA